jgi:hypothetical protein
MPYKLGKALIYAVLLWVIGFVWGSIVFMTPPLKMVAAIPYVSSNPAISFPILIIWLIATYLLAKGYLQEAGNKAAEGLKLGIVFSVVNVLLDLLVLVFLLKAGFSYFISITVWLGYFMLFMIPWIAGRSLQVEMLFPPKCAECGQRIKGEKFEGLGPGWRCQACTIRVEEELDENMRNPIEDLPKT